MTNHNNSNNNTIIGLASEIMSTAQTSVLVKIVDKLKQHSVMYWWERGNVLTFTFLLLLSSPPSLPFSLSFFISLCIAHTHRCTHTLTRTQTELIRRLRWHIFCLNSRGTLPDSRSKWAQMNGSSSVLNVAVVGRHRCSCSWLTSLSQLIT